MSYAKLKAEILENYGEEVRAAVNRLCQSPCSSWNACGKEGGDCIRKLLPICSDGSDCPYYGKREMELTQ